MTSNSSEKVRENRLRRAAQRQGLRLSKNARRDPRALDYGAWYLIDQRTNTVVVGGDSRWGLDDIETYLKGDA